MGFPSGMADFIRDDAVTTSGRSHGRRGDAAAISFGATKLGSERVSPHRGANLNKRSAGSVATQGLSQK
jgi:hypothetical protein